MELATRGDWSLLNYLLWHFLPMIFVVVLGSITLIITYVGNDIVDGDVMIFHFDLVGSFALNVGFLGIAVMLVVAVCFDCFFC